MGYCVTGIISSKPVVERLGQEFGWVHVDLRDGLWLLPLDDQDFDALGLDFSMPAPGFTYLSPDFGQFCADHSARGPLVYFETEYFGGMGDQAAAAFSAGCALPRSQLAGEGAINAALRYLGVVAAKGLDEFDFVGLSRYRHTSDWKDAGSS